MQVKIFTGKSGSVELRLNTWLKDNDILISQTNINTILTKNIVNVEKTHVTIVVWYEIEEKL